VIVYTFLLIVVLVLDQSSKFWIVSNFSLYEMREMIPGFFNLVYVTNKGAAFSMFASIESPVRHYFFVLVNGGAVIGLTIAAFKMRSDHLLYRISFALIGAGALGNLIDRLRFGAVIDFLDFYITTYHWPAFNVADSSICIGVALLFISNIMSGSPKKNTRSS
jgi:signal peptidase II